MFGIDKKMLYIILGVMLLMSMASMGQDGILSLVLTLPGVIIAITFHEFAHAFVADKLGDDTARRQGRLNLNPLSHMDPIGFVLLLVAGFGWGKPVEINPRNFDRKISMSAAEAIVSVAGPLMNFVLAFVFLIIMYLAFPTGGAMILSGNIQAVWYYTLMYAVMINIGLGVFNLIPLPPLDGSKILKHFLPYNAKQWFEEHEQIFYIVFIILWITGLSGTILTPIFEGVFNGINWIVGSIFNLFV